MRKVFSSHSEVCHVFASRSQDEGRASNVFFEGDTLYSYGYHFPMATFSENGQTVYFTTQGYSVSTSKHLGYARSALSHFDFIYCYDPKAARDGRHAKNLQNFNDLAKEQAYKLRNARKPEIYLNEIAYLRGQFETYCEHFKIKQTKKLIKSLPYLFIESKEGGQKATEKEARAMERARKEQAKREAARHAEELAEFKAFERQRMYSRNGFDYLRFNKVTNVIETSQGMRIEIEEAERVYKLVQVAIERGGCTNCGRVDDRYIIKSISSEFLVVGCHNIPISEVLTVGKELFEG